MARPMMLAAFLAVALASQASSDLPPPAVQDVPGSEAAFISDDECVAGGSSPGCAVNALQARSGKVHAQANNEATRVAHIEAAAAAHAQAANASKAVGSEGDMCQADTAGSCVWLGCSSWRGPTKCERGRCLCSTGYCAKQGICTERGTCNIVTSGTCNVLSCAASRGQTKCRGGQCVCKSGFCADSSGKCEPDKP
mmetsp:Transcript_18499/g.50187  ORF Transcript_18499/g.50187 Transcript_18499/m.50187 type:complete len:196 (-) Transcript_18499:97-684(-)